MMGIRNYNKDNLKTLGQQIVPVLAVDLEILQEDFLKFWTKHPTSPMLVDLTVFREGESENADPAKNWLGGFTGRPELINELAPVFRLVLEDLVPNSVIQYIHASRSWWRLFDSVHRNTQQYESPIIVENIGDIVEIHRQYAFDHGMDAQVFTKFIRIVNLAKKLKSQRPLFWEAPERTIKSRHLPPKWQIDKIRFSLKHSWFATLFRWQKKDELLNNVPVSFPASEDEILKKNYLHFQRTTEATNNPRPSGEQLYSELSHEAFNIRNFHVTTMLRGFYPDAHDIRTAFNLCLANTGWNPSVLLALNVENGFIENHPKDESRYLMRGHKGRGDSEQITEGLLKSQGSAGVIIRTVMERTVPLREQLRKALDRLRQEFIVLKTQKIAIEKLNIKLEEIVKLQQGIYSPWLYVTSTSGRISWLTKATYGAGLDKKLGTTFLEEVILRINNLQPTDRQLARFKPSDFRDAFAVYAYHVSGGLVLHVMKALGHKLPKTTQAYLDNNVLNEESDNLFKKHNDIFWREIKIYARVDPTILAKWARDGVVTEEDRSRLDKYRKLLRSRIGVGCKNPRNPPKHIAPNFVPNGKNMCSTHRCMLCVENAVLFNDSLAGICKRLAELYYIRENMSSASFLESSFGEEINNTELAIKNFDAAEASLHFTEWKKKIADRTHHVIDLDGL